MKPEMKRSLRHEIVNSSLSVNLKDIFIVLLL